MNSAITDSRRIGLAMATLAGAALLLLSLASPSDAAYPGKAGKIAFERLVGGVQWDLFAVNSDKGGLVNLTGSSTNEFGASFNGDGNRMVFQRTNPVTGADDIWTAKPDGTGQLNITNSALENEQNPVFSPEGGRILYVAPNGTFLDIFSMNADGSNRVNLTNTAGGADFSPAFTPDGQTIFFSATTAGGDAEIFTMARDGSNRRQITFNSLQDDEPDVSPDGRLVVFSRDTGSGNVDVFSMAPDGSGETNITNSNAVENAPVYSPNNRRIAFARDTDSDSATDEIFVTDPLTPPVNVSESGAGDSDFTNDWQPVPILCGGKRSTIVGSKAREKLRGTARNDVIWAGAGRDQVNGFGGRDTICGAAGKDKLFGGGAADRLLGGKNRDSCQGGTGKDHAKKCESGKGISRKTRGN